MDNKVPGKDISGDDLLHKIPLATSGANSKIHLENHIISNETLTIMAGPNLVENEEMIFEIASEVKKSGGHILRGGAFKPLTFPYRSNKYFETGEQGLIWLKNAGSYHKLPTISEVTSVSNLDLVASYVDILQIGTRNMQNFDLLIEAARTNKPILLKRGFGSSLRDFLDAVEYILNEGNENLVLCERGVVAPHTHRQTSRFMLDLQIIPALKEISSLPIITDPSHATFWANWVPSLALASIAAGSQGVMLEVHPNPSEAAVDPLQALDYEQFASLVNKLESQFLLIKSFDRE